MSESPLSFSGWRRRASPGSARGASKAQQTPPRVATSAARGFKRRGRLKLSAKRPRASRLGSANGGRVARTAPEPDPQEISSMDDSSDLTAATTPTPGGTVGGRRITGAGIFASLTRRRSGEGQQQPSNQLGDGAGAPATPSPSAVLSPPERSRGKGGGGGGVGAGWLRPNSAVTQVASKAFFGAGEDDAGHDSWSSTDEDEGNRPGGTQSYIRVTCTARTSYKLFSTNPQVRGGLWGGVPFFPCVWNLQSRAGG